MADIAKPYRTKVKAGMGSIPHKLGTSFRVWAPHAQKVFVMGTFNDWNREKTPLTHEGDGYWAVDVPGARSGDEYKFVIINGDLTLDRTDPYAREMTSSIGNSVIRDPLFDWGEAQDFPSPNWNEMVIYEMHIGTFATEDPDEPGTFSQAIRKMAYLKNLGVNAIQVMPPMEFPGGRSWGYNPAHPFAIESDYGGPRAFMRFVRAAHRNGMAVIVDVVYNHFGPTDIDLWQFDGWSENGMGGIYFYNDWRAQTPWGHTRPDYGRGEVRQYIRDNALSWFEEYQVDGLRFDATAYIRRVDGIGTDPAGEIPEGWSLLQWINEEVQERYPGCLTIAEDLQSNEWVTKDIGAGGAGFGSQWDAGFVHPVRSAIIMQNDNGRDMNAVRNALLGRYEGDVFKRVIYTESHDEVANGKQRVVEEIWPGNSLHWFAKKRSTLGAGIVMTAPGIPMLFQGQEFMEGKWFNDEDPLDWNLEEHMQGIVGLYRDLIRLRRNLDGFTRGLTGQHVQVFHVNNLDKIIAYHRWMDGGPRDSVVVAANFKNVERRDYALGFPSGGAWKLRFDSHAARYDAEFTGQVSADVSCRDEPYDGLPHTGIIHLAPYSLVFYSKDE